MVSVLGYMRDDLHADLFDVRLLASREPIAREATVPVVPFCPLLTQSWHLLKARRVEMAAPGSPDGEPLPVRFAVDDLRTRRSGAHHGSDHERNTQMRILMIHGRAQGGHLADDLQSTWTKTLQEGFGAASKSWPTALDVDFPYYADTLGDRLAAQANLPTPADVVAKGTGQNLGV